MTLLPARRTPALAAGRATVPILQPACLACGTTTAPLETADLVGAGLVKRCADPALCRRRAELAGTWCTT